NGQSQYVWSPFYPDELIERDRDADTGLDGALDTSFDADGKQTTSFGSGSSNTDEGKAVVVQPDGKTIAVGYDGVYVDLVRYNRDGSLDSSFGTGGKVQA